MARSEVRAPHNPLQYRAAVTDHHRFLWFPGDTLSPQRRAAEEVKPPSLLLLAFVFVAVMTREKGGDEAGMEDRVQMDPNLLS